jgi:hypothetical protein
MHLKVSVFSLALGLPGLRSFILLLSVMKNVMVVVVMSYV